ncbi:MAG: M48 family metallopeptidase [Burkholderiaceae bacterium]|nr:M48 family metallopeptidase [Burkholderiaceae bacterium]
MNFFDHQQQARVASKRLIVLFALAVIGTVVAVNAVVAVAATWFGGVAPGVQVVTAGGLVLDTRQVPLGLHVLVTLIVLLAIGGGTWFEMNRLRAGGDAVAQMVGARLVDPGTRDSLERRLVNVVEEMALASGTPVPRVYVMDGEPGINAFAAGHTVNDAVVAVTRGTLDKLNRDELQGVIAHEFSHILNGDMGLNLRLIGVLFGLMMIAMVGRFLMEAGRGSRDSKGVAAAAFLGLALWIIGYVGVFFGRLIKAGVSRQREFLADASAVQFTRNPDGIGGALRKIGGLTTTATATPNDAAAGLALGTEIRHAHAETLSHLFLGAARSNFARGMLATHPPLDERIRRIFGRAMDLLPAPEQPVALALAGEAPSLASGVGGASDARAAVAAMSPFAGLAAGSMPTAQRVTDAIGQSATTPRVYVESWADRVQSFGLGPALNDSVRAPLLVLALLVEKRSEVAQQQLDAIAQTYGREAAAEVQALHSTVQQLPPGARLPLLDLAMPALRKLAPASGDRLLMLAHTLILADGRMTLAEFLLFTVLRRRLGTDAQRPVPLRYKAVRDVAEDAARVLSLLAHVRDPLDPARPFAQAQAALPDATLALVPAEQLALDRITAALDRLNQLVPLAKPAFIKACAGVALDGGSTHWKAASCLRTICAALDAPLPPAVREVVDQAQ